MFHSLVDLCKHFSMETSTHQPITVIRQYISNSSAKLLTVQYLHHLIWSADEHWGIQITVHCYHDDSDGRLVWCAIIIGLNANLKQSELSNFLTMPNTIINYYPFFLKCQLFQSFNFVFKIYK